MKFEPGELANRLAKADEARLRLRRMTISLRQFGDLALRQWSERRINKNNSKN